MSKYPVIVQAEQRTQVPKTYLALGTLALLAISHTFNALAAPTSNLVGFALPAYLSVRAIESPAAQDDVQWLTYWVVFGFFNFLESFCLRVVLYYFPWYFAFKSIFVIWLQLPAFRVRHSYVIGRGAYSRSAFQGAQTLYHSALKPLVSKGQVATRPEPTFQAPAE